MPNSTKSFTVKKAKPDDWQLRLFFSVDLIGSTDFKASRMYKSDDQHPDTVLWHSPFKKFYSDFPRELQCEASELEKKSKITLTSKDNGVVQPAPWKYLGDEILLSAIVNDSRAVPLYVVAFKNALRKYSDKLKKSSQMECKGTMWTAGFPVSNRRVSPGGRNKPVDFIGPHMDCGFRLAKFSTERLLMISLDVVWMVSEHLDKGRHSIFNDDWQKENDVRIYFHGMEVLKGIMAGRSYPVFGVDTVLSNEIPSKHPNDQLLRYLDRKPCDLAQVCNFCYGFTKANELYLFKPFIDSDPGKLFCDPPSAEFVDKWRRIKELEEMEKHASLKQPPTNDVKKLDPEITKTTAELVPSNRGKSGDRSTKKKGTKRRRPIR